jgi:hypothetical protein
MRNHCGTAALICDACAAWDIIAADAALDFLAVAPFFVFLVGILLIIRDYVCLVV